MFKESLNSIRQIIQSVNQLPIEQWPVSRLKLTTDSAHLRLSEVKAILAIADKQIRSHIDNMTA